MKTVPTKKGDHPIPTRYSLLSRLQDWDDQDSWRDFFDTYWRLIYSVAIKSGLSDAEAKDVVQETVISVAKSIHKFKRDRALGSFKGWLRNIIRWRVADHLQKRKGTAREARSFTADFSTSDLEEIPDVAAEDPEPAWDQEWRSNLFEAAMDRVKHQVKEEHYQMFDLYVIKEWPVTKVARKLRVSVGLVYLVKHRISGLIRKEVRRLEKNPFNNFTSRQ